MLDIAQSLGVVHLCIVFLGVILLFGLLGLCCPSFQEPYPRIVQYSYPSHAENRWFLMHVSKTALKRDYYVSSISNFVSARGTTPSKLMLLLMTSLCLSSAYIQGLLWTLERIPTATLVLSLVSSVGLGLLGWVESSLQWAPLPVDYPDLESDVDKQRMEDYYKQMEITRLTGEEDAQIKSQFATLHLISAFTFIIGQFVAQLVLYTHDPHSTMTLSSCIVAVVGMGMFTCFSLLQWITGASDSMLQGGRLSSFAIANVSWLQCFYFPQNGSLPQPTLKRVSVMFVMVEICAFGAMCVCPALNALIE
jgi:hypothetical protein